MFLLLIKDVFSFFCIVLRSLISGKYTEEWNNIFVNKREKLVNQKNKTDFFSQATSATSDYG